VCRACNEVEYRLSAQQTNLRHHAHLHSLSRCSPCPRSMMYSSHRMLAGVRGRCSNTGAGQHSCAVLPSHHRESLRIPQIGAEAFLNSMAAVSHQSIYDRRLNAGCRQMPGVQRWWDSRGRQPALPQSKLRKRLRLFCCKHRTLVKLDCNL